MSEVESTAIGGAQTRAGPTLTPPPAVSNPFVAALVPPVISGAPNENIRQQFNLFDRFCQCLALTEDRKAAVLAQYLTGAARTVYESLTQDQRQPYQSVRELLIQRLAPLNATDLAMKQLRKRKQKRGETINEYAGSISRLVSEALPATIDDAAKDQIKTTLFLEGLRIRNKQLVRFPRPKNFEDAVTRARQQEGLDSSSDDSSDESESRASKRKSNRKGRSPLPRLVATVNREDTTEQRNGDEIAKLSRQIAQLTDRVDKLGRDRPHLQQSRNTGPTLPIFRGTGRGRNVNSTFAHARTMDTRRWTQDGRPICMSCGKAGHIFAMCRQNPRGGLQQRNRSSQGNQQNDRFRNNESRAANATARPAAAPATRQRPSTQRQTNLIYIPDPTAAETTDEAEEMHNSCYFIANKNHQAVKDPKQLYKYAKEMAEIADQERQSTHRKKQRNECFMIQMLNLSASASIQDTTPVKKHESKSTFTILSFIASFFFALICMRLVPSTEALNYEYNFCKFSRSGYAVAVPNDVICHPPDLEDISHVTASIYVPRSEPKTITAWKCKIQYTCICTFTSFFGAKSLTTPQETKILDIDEKTCRIAIQRKIWKSQILKELSNGIWSTQNILQVHYKWCCYDVCTDSTNLILEAGEVGTLNGHQIISDLGDTGGCVASLGRCFTHDGLIIWEHNELDHVCQYEFKGDFEAQLASSGHIVVEALQGAFTTNASIAKPQCKDLPPQALMTDQGVAIYTAPREQLPTANYTLHRPKRAVNASQQGVLERILEKNDIAESFLPTIQPRVEFNDDALAKSNPLNTQLEFLEFQVLQIVQQGFRQIWTALCVQAQTTLRITKQFLRLDPTMGARILMNSTDIVAAWAGEALVVWKCQKVNVTHIQWDYKYQNKCYEYVPVEAESQLFFIIPGSRDLTVTSREVSCDHHLIGLHFNGKQWESPNGIAHVAQVPIELAWQGHYKYFTFRAPLLYHNEFSGIPATISMLRSYHTRIAILEKQLSILTNYSAEYSMDPQVIVNAIAGVGQGIGDMMAGGAKAAENMLTGLGHAAKDVLSGAGDMVGAILKGPFQAILNCILIAALILGALALLYVGIRYWRQRRKRAKNVIESDVEQQPDNKQSGGWKSIFYRSFDKKPIRSRTPSVRYQADAERVSMAKFEPSQVQPALSVQVEIPPITTSQKPIPHLYTINQTSSGSQESSNIGNDLDVPLIAHKILISVPLNNKKLVSKTYVLNGFADCGAAITIVSDIVPKILKIPIEPISVPATSASGHQLNLIGNIILNFNCEGNEVEHRAYIMPGANFHLLMGRDLMKKLKLVIDMDNCRLLTAEQVRLPPIKNNTLPFYDTKIETVKKLPTVCLIENIKIPACSHNIIWGKTEDKDHGPKLLESKSLQRDGLLLADVVAESKHGYFPIQLMNVSSEPIQLYEGTRIGYLYECQPVSMNEQLTNIIANPEFKLQEAQGCLTKATQHLVSGKAIYNIDTETLKTPIADLLKAVKVGDSAVTEAEKLQINQLLRKNIDVISQHPFDLGLTDLIELKVDVGDTKPVAQKPYRIPFAMRTEVERQINELLKHDIIEPSMSPWAHPLVCVKKKDGSIRLCTDLRRLNVNLKKDQFPLPNIKDIIDNLAGAQYFTTIDLRSGFQQVAVHPEDREKLAFTTPFGLYQYKRAPFGIATMPSLFQRLMTMVLAGLIGHGVFVYIDDILISSPTFAQHLVDIQNVFDCLRRAKLKIKLSKCEFCKSSLVYLGYRISRKGVEPDPQKVEAINKALPPTNLTEVQSFLGKINYYASFVPALADIAEPIRALTCKGAKFDWTATCQRAFEELKRRLTRWPILALPNFNFPFYLQVDASNYAVGAVLSQKIQGMERAIAYASRALRKHELNYPTIEKEILALVWGYQHFKPYLYGRRFYVESDHRPLSYLLTKKKLSARLEKWALQLQEADVISINYRPGKHNANADYMSRLRMADKQYGQCKSDNSMQNSDCLQIDTVLQEYSKDKMDPWENIDIKREQRNDSDLLPMIIYKETQQLPEEPQLARYIANTENLYFLNDTGILMHKQPVPKIRREGYFEQLVIPKHLRPEVLRQNHDNVLCGHMGEDRTIARIQTKYFWPNMLNDITQYVKACLACATRKRSSRPTRVPLKSIPVVRVFQRVAMDLMGPLPLTENGNRYIAVFTDYFSKYVEVDAIENQSADRVARCFVEVMIARHGVPESFLTDRGSNFTSDTMRGICKLLNVKKLFTTAFHAQTDGLCERFNSTCCTILSNYVSTNGHNWDRFLRLAAFAYNTSVHSSTGDSPFFLIYGRDPQLPLDGDLSVSNPSYLDELDYRDQLLLSLRAAYQHAKDNIEKAQATQKKYYDRTARPHTFKLGDLCMLYTPSLNKDANKKFARYFRGPFRIVELLEQNAIIVPLHNNKRQQRVHLNRLKKYHGPYVPPLERPDETNYEQLQEQPDPPMVEVPIPEAEPQQPRYNLRPRKSNYIMDINNKGQI